MPEGSINLGHVVGPTGPQGATGPAGPQGVQGPVGPGVPAGGTAGQVLRKTDGTNYNTEWHSLDDADIPSSAVSGQTTVEGALGSLSQQIGKLECLVVNCGTISSLPTTISNANIEDDMVVLQSTLGTLSAQTGDWTVTTAAGSLTISGSISGSTTLTLYLAKSR